MAYGQTICVLATLAAAMGLTPAWAASPSSTPSFDIAIRHQAFEPPSVTVPAGQVVTLMVNNEDAQPAEFESGDLGREKVIPGGTRRPVVVGPLKPGRYGFFNDFHSASTGTLIAVPPKP